MPPGFSIRSPVLADARAVAHLLNAIDQADGATPDWTETDIAADWGDIDLQTDAWLVEGSDGEAVAYAYVEGHAGVDFRGEVTVHPDVRGQGLGGALLARVERRVEAAIADAPPDARITMAGHARADSPSAAWAERRGYAGVRHLNRMTITLTSAPEAPAWPAGIAVRTFVPGRDEQAVFASLAESFADHWGSIPLAYHEWSRVFDRPDFDPSLWFLATDGAEVVGTSLGSVMPDSGWVRGVGVRRAWRRRGIARALMLETFGAFWDRGIPTVGLGVDATSLTGATDMYLGLGMRVMDAYVRMEREMRPGRDLATRSLS